MALKKEQEIMTEYELGNVDMNMINVDHTS